MRNKELWTCDFRFYGFLDLKKNKCDGWEIFKILIEKLIEMNAIIV